MAANGVGYSKNRVHSLDSVYYFHGQLDFHEHIVTLPHSPVSSKEISLKQNDIVIFKWPDHNGYSFGMNKRTNETGLYPNYKVRQKWKPEQFPEYDDNIVKVKQIFG